MEVKREQTLRSPKQARAQKRVEEILNTARKLIGEKGCASLKMTEIAESAGMTMGSMYQYFPNKRAIVQTLCDEYLDESRRSINASLTPPPNDFEELSHITMEMLEEFYRFHRDEPILSDISNWFASDKSMNHIDGDDTQQVTETIMKHCGHLFDQSKIEETRQAIHLFFNCGVAIVNTALIQPSPAKSRQNFEIGKKLIFAMFDNGIRPLAITK